jgi:hypothetical protein
MTTDVTSNHTTIASVMTPRDVAAPVMDRSF